MMWRRWGRYDDGFHDDDGFSDDDGFGDSDGFSLL